MGYGTKYDFTKANKDKTAPFYNMGSDFDPKKHEHAAYTFGIGRQYYEKVYCESSTFGDKKIPGPGNYNYVRSIGHDCPKFTIVGRHKEPSNKHKVPGPGEYPFVSMNIRGRYPLSKMRNATSIVWSCSKAKRFVYDSNYIINTYYNTNYVNKTNSMFKLNTYIIIIENPNPGPGQYESKPLLNGTGSIFDSKYKSCGAKTLGIRTKVFWEGSGKSMFI